MALMAVYVLFTWRDSPRTLKQTRTLQIEDDTIARRLAEKVRVLCWIMTGPENHKKKAVHVKNTWGQRCNILLFMSTAEDAELPTVALPIPEGRDHLWVKTREAFRYIWQNYRDQADWFMKADDDTYVVVENLRHMLSSYDSNEPLWFGHRFQPTEHDGSYFSGGAGYVLSKEALRRFATNALNDLRLCADRSPEAEDVEMGLCMTSINITFGDTRDQYGRGRFFPFSVEKNVVPGFITENLWYWNYTYYPIKTGVDCCSDTAITFHYVTPNQMYVLDYLIYRLKPYGIQRKIISDPLHPPLLPGN